MAAFIRTHDDGRVVIPEELVADMEFVLGVLEESHENGFVPEIDLSSVACITGKAVQDVLSLLGCRLPEVPYQGDAANWMETTAQTLAAATFLQVPKVESALCISLGAAIRTECSSFGEACSHLQIDSGDLEEQEMEHVRSLLARSNAAPFVMWRSSDSTEDPGLEICEGSSDLNKNRAQKLWWKHADAFRESAVVYRRRAQKLGNSQSSPRVNDDTHGHNSPHGLVGEEEASRQGKDAEHAPSVQEAVCRAAIRRVASKCALGLLSEDVLCRIAMHAGKHVQEIANKKGACMQQGEARRHETD
jgi:hypothetical protein